MLETDASIRRNAFQKREETSMLCCDENCLQKMHIEDAHHAINDSVYWRSFDMQILHSHVKILYLCSLSRNDAETAVMWPTKPNAKSYLIPNCRSKMCLVSFRYLLGVSKATLNRIIKSCRKEPSSVAEKHKLSNKTGKDSNKMNIALRSKMIIAINEVLDEYAQNVPWSTSNVSEEVQSKMLPPYFSKERLFAECTQKLGEDDCLSLNPFCGK